MYLQPATGYLFLFMFGAVATFISLLVLLVFKEELDVKRLESRGILEPEYPSLRAQTITSNKE